MDSKRAALLRCEKISKRFKGVQALKDVDFSIYPGVVHGLVGENGAGKSTLMKIISGVYSLDQGRIVLADSPVSISNTEQALKRGIVTIYQEINLIETMTVAENIYLNNEPTYKPTGLIRKKDIRENVLSLLSRYDIDADPDSPVSSLPNDVKKVVQIIKAVSRDAKVLLMDEPTSSLTKVEEKRVLQLIRSLAESGVGIVFISHYFSEIFEVCDLITVLRDGKVVGTVETEQTTMPEVVKMMIGRTIDETGFRKESFKTEQQVFSVRKMNVKRKLKDISFSLNKGEVLGITGLIGSGCAELAKAIFGSVDIKRESGDFAINGKQIKIKHPENAVANRIALITDDRINEGLLPKLPLYENICLPTLKKFKNRMNLLNKSEMVRRSKEYVKLLDIKTPSVMTSAESLSGGNQQKVLLAKWLETEPLVFVMNEPTIGVDVGTKYEIRKLIKKIASDGVSILLITSELEELEKLCDRVLVMFRGQIVKEFIGDDIHKANILEASTSGR